jgi:hypothetical protein
MVFANFYGVNTAAMVERASVTSWLSQAHTSSWHWWYSSAIIFGLFWKDKIHLSRHHLGKLRVGRVYSVLPPPYPHTPAYGQTESNSWQKTSLESERNSTLESTLSNSEGPTQGSHPQCSPSSKHTGLRVGLSGTPEQTEFLLRHSSETVPLVNSHSASDSKNYLCIFIHALINTFTCVVSNDLEG